MSDITLVLGGARSGKTSRALALARTAAEENGGKLIYIATAEAGDEEMAERISRHRSERSPQWETLEAPLDLAETIAAQSQASQVVVVDCLTLWLSNILLADRDLDAETDKLARAVRIGPAKLILVSNEVGLGIVPQTALGRHFRDGQGRLNQRVAGIADTVEFIAAGLVLRLKPQ